ncbi:putative ribonuclease H protein [Senna tora]|uniref:Putative ribonuclease H protein n=1 Tax=Senna tora TaxID=362788 RepID=A0A834WJC6_9FABA|nr:putative ribonuclease H protein [Senna tora]
MSGIPSRMTNLTMLPKLLFASMSAHLFESRLVCFNWTTQLLLISSLTLVIKGGQGLTELRPPLQQFIATWESFSRMILRKPRSHARDNPSAMPLNSAFKGFDSPIFKASYYDRVSIRETYACIESSPFQITFQTDLDMLSFRFLTAESALLVVKWLSSLYAQVGTSVPRSTFGGLVARTKSTAEIGRTF